jgi:hypothetical protein
MATSDLSSTNAVGRGGRSFLALAIRRRHVAPRVSLPPRSMRARNAWVAAVHARGRNKRGLGRARVHSPCVSVPAPLNRTALPGQEERP